MGNVVAIIKDDRAVFRCRVSRAFLLLIGCASHELNLVIKDKFEIKNSHSSKIIQCNVKLQSWSSSACLRKLCPCFCNYDWYLLEFIILYTSDIRRVPWVLRSLDEIYLNTLSLTPADNRKVDIILNLNKHTEGLFLDLQRDNFTSNVLKNVLNLIMAFPSMQDKLRPNAKIVHNAFFKDAIVQNS